MGDMDFVQIQLDFLRTEVRLGLTFLGIAQTAGDDKVKALRNFANALKAYDALVHYVRVVKMTDAQAAELQVGIEKLALGLSAS